MKPHSNNKALIYVRVSTLEQSQHGVSLDAQEALGRAYCTANRLEVVALIREEGVSASKPLALRPGGQKALALLASGEVQHFVVVKLCRAFRDTVDALTQTREWDRNGTAFHVIDLGGQSLNSASAMGRMFLTIVAALGEMERGLISERTSSALRYKQSQGVVLGAPMLTDPATLARIHALHRQGLTLREVAATLTAEGIATKRGGKWAPATLAKVLARK